MTSATGSPFSRRKILAGLGFGVAAAGAMASPALQLSWTRKPGPAGNWWDRQSTTLAHAGMDEWKGQVGSEFRLGGTTAKLRQVTALPSGGRRPPGVRDQAFALVFEASGSLPPGDAMHDVVHPEAGKMKIYFSDCGESCGGRRLQAVFG